MEDEEGTKEEEEEESEGEVADEEEEEEEETDFNEDAVVNPATKDMKPKSLWDRLEEDKQVKQTNQKEQKDDESKHSYDEEEEKGYNVVKAALLPPKKEDTKDENEYSYYSYYSSGEESAGDEACSYYSYYSSGEESAGDEAVPAPKRIKLVLQPSKEDPTAASAAAVSAAEVEEDLELLPAVTTQPAESAANPCFAEAVEAAMAEKAIDPRLQGKDLAAVDDASEAEPEEKTKGKKAKKGKKATKDKAVKAPTAKGRKKEEEPSEKPAKKMRKPSDFMVFMGVKLNDKTFEPDMSYKERFSAATKLWPKKEYATGCGKCRGLQHGCAKCNPAGFK